MSEKNSESEHTENDTSCAWNRCPTCGELVDVDDCVDGSEVTCRACNARLVLTEYVDDTCGLSLADESNGEDTDADRGNSPAVVAFAPYADSATRVIDIVTDYVDIPDDRYAAVLVALRAWFAASDSRIPSLATLATLLTKYRAQSHGEPIDLLGAIQTAEARAEAAREHPDPSVRRILLLDCAAWALAAVCEIDGAQASAPVAVTREANDEGSGP
jgi:hypothetical protein